MALDTGPATHAQGQVRADGALTWEGVDDLAYGCEVERRAATALKFITALGARLPALDDHGREAWPPGVGQARNDRPGNVGHKQHIDERDAKT